MVDSDIVIVVEGFSKKDVDITRYSLSTKVADSLASGANILAYGSPECGAFEYLREIKCATVCNDFDELVLSVKSLIENRELQWENYVRSQEITAKHHSSEVSTYIFESVIDRVVNR
jgi:hypothetical protein